MLTKLRLSLTLWFVTLSLIVYCILAIIFTFIFKQLQTELANQEIRGLSREIRPSIVITNNVPTLIPWAKAAKSLAVKLLATIELFAIDGRLLESYGPDGTGILQIGFVRNHNQSLLSYYKVIIVNKKIYGYLQIQLPTKTIDDSLNRLIWTLIIVAPLLLAALGISGYFFSGLAIKPTERSFLVLQQFMADAGHELSTPMAVIQASIDTLEDSFQGNEANLQVVSVMSKALVRMNSLVKDLMLLAKMEVPQLVLQKKTLNLKNLIDEIVLGFKELFEQKGVSLSVELNSDKSILGHEESVMALVTNLIQNALKYTDSGGSVKVSLNEKNNLITFAVQDTGIGIAESDLTNIFNRFYRVEKSRNRNQGGSGLGLAIVKAICDAHNCVIKVDSKLGQGSVFRVIFKAVQE